MIPLILSYLPAAKKLLTNKWVLIGAGVLVLSSIAGAQTWRLSQANEKVGEYREKLATAAEAARSNYETVDALRLANERLTEALRVTAEARDEAVSNLEEANEQIRDELGETRRELSEALQSTPSCEELAALDIGRMCPAAADSLRDALRQD